MAARICLLAALLPASASAQGWTEASVARLAAERAPAVREAWAAAERARGAAEGAGLLPNPSIAWERQEAFDPNAQTQDILTARIPIDLSGRPAAERALADLDALAAEATAESARSLAVAVALEAFYGALAAERRAELLVGAQATLDEAGRVMERRRAAGEASGYAEARLALEAELARSQLAESRVAASAQRAALAALLGVDETPGLVGDLDATAPAPIEALLARAEARGDVAALDRADAAASRAADAAGWAWVPRLDVEGGYNRVDGPVPGHGYAVGVAIEVPLFDHGQGPRARASAARAAIAAVREATLARARAQIRAAHAQLEGLRAERARFAEATGAAAELLATAATSGYREGERSLVELLDARRAVVENAQRRLALDLAVRLADVRLRGATGDL
ncbi:MAG: TolC family protein [Sandaracinaceae bacterium]|nr:TolC family protein [Sandaracinaceae bacterium]